MNWMQLLPNLSRTTPLVSKFEMEALVGDNTVWISKMHCVLEVEGKDIGGLIRLRGLTKMVHDVPHLSLPKPEPHQRTSLSGHWLQ